VAVVTVALENNLFYASFDVDILQQSKHKTPDFMIVSVPRTHVDVIYFSKMMM